MVIEVFCFFLLASLVGSTQAGSVNTCRTVSHNLASTACAAKATMKNKVTNLLLHESHQPHHHAAARYHRRHQQLQTVAPWIRACTDNMLHELRSS
jgi:hypothetical protein